MPGGTIDVAIAGTSPTPSLEALHAWVDQAARAIARYYGVFPVFRVAMTVRVGGPGSISGGRTDGREGGATIDIGVGQDTTAEDFASNWELVHEMVHLAFPSMTGHAWIEEGIATYVEPLARARAGLIASDEIWTWLAWGLPRGQAGIGPNGLDGSRTWAATYWGGALYSFLADVEIRERTGNRKSLDDALRGITRAGGNVTVIWPIEKALEAGDRATGVPVLAALYERMRRAPANQDLDGLFRKLGVRVSGKTVSTDDAAPLAASRRGITTGKP